VEEASSRNMARWLLLLLCQAAFLVAANDQSVEDLLASMKGMPGMENIKIFGADDLKNMDPSKMADAFGGGGAPPRPKKQTRSQYRRRLVQFYETYGLTDKIAGVDAALDKWKGREEKMFDVLHKKYADVIDAKLAADAEEAETADEADAEADAAFASSRGKTEL